MKESEYAENNVNARDIIANVLKTLGMNAPSFSKATGIAYMRIFDLQRGRTKKFNPGVVNTICAAFPQINKNYLYTGEGNVLNSDIPADLMDNPLKTTDQNPIPFSVSSSPHHPPHGYVGLPLNASLST